MASRQGRDGQHGLMVRPRHRCSSRVSDSSARRRVRSVDAPVRVSATRLNAWLDRWGAILPLLLAEFIVWLGFGALLPVLPLYFTEQGVDLALLGIVIAAWPAARLVGEPIFGWLADRTARVPLMVVGLLATGLFCDPAAGPDRAGRVHRPARLRRARRPRCTTRPPAAT